MVDFTKFEKTHHLYNMIRYVLCLLIVTFSSKMSAQYCDFYNSSEVIHPTVESASEFLSDFFKETLQDSKLRLTAETKSLAAVHFNFEQTVGDIAIANTFVKISIAKDGKIVSIYEQLASSKNLITGFFLPLKISALSIENSTIESTENVWWIDNEMLVPALKIITEDKGHKKSMSVFSNKGKVYETPMSFHFMPDSMVSGKVFYPDPLTSSGHVYGGLYRDFNDSDTAALNNERKTKLFKVDFDGSIFQLKNASLELSDLDNDGTPIATSSTPFFDFTRGQKGFEDVNAFYHISALQQRLVDLGFNISVPKVIIDPHGTSADNSFFTYPNFIYFGTGGVDDAEDADVLLHEYSHFLSRNAAPNTNVGMERQGLDEGLGDYVAASYSQAISTFKKEWVYNWDGHNEYWSGRSVNTTRLYPNDKLNNIYKDGEMWSSTLMQIHDELGRGKTDSILFESIYQYASNMSYPMAAQALLKTDSLLFTGANSSVLTKYLGQRCYLQSTQYGCNVGIATISKSQLNVINTTEGFILSSEEKIVEFSLFDLLGHQIIQSNTSTFSGRKELQAGIYIIYAKTKEGVKIAKWWSGY